MPPCSPSWCSSQSPRELVLPMLRCAEGLPCTGALRQADVVRALRSLTRLRNMCVRRTRKSLFPAVKTFKKLILTHWSPFMVSPMMITFPNSVSGTPVFVWVLGPLCFSAWSLYCREIIVGSTLLFTEAQQYFCGCLVVLSHPHRSRHFIVILLSNRFLWW